MNGEQAQARFTCTAQIRVDSALVEKTYPCGHTALVNLHNDGQYDGFVTPEGWHIALGTDLRRGGAVHGTIVRCPNHCRWVTNTDPTSFEQGRGHWEDDQ